MGARLDRVHEAHRLASPGCEGELTAGRIGDADATPAACCRECGWYHWLDDEEEPACA